MDKTTQLRFSSDNSIPIAFKLILLANKKGTPCANVSTYAKTPGQDFYPTGSRLHAGSNTVAWYLYDLRPSSDEMWGFTALRQCLLRYSCLNGVRYPSLNHKPTISIILIYNRPHRRIICCKSPLRCRWESFHTPRALLCSLFETK